MSDAASAQVNAQKRRLIAARAIDESEKRMYVQVGSQTLFFVITHASHVCSQHSFGLPLRRQWDTRLSYATVMSLVALLMLFELIFLIVIVALVVYRPFLRRNAR